jgi:hypothetical protein
MSRQMNSNGTLNSYVASGNDVQNGDRYGYKIIAVVHGKLFYSAYRGLTDWPDEKVAQEGDSVPHDIAKILFPVLEALLEYEE